jgi:hypothetical protein
LDDDNYLKMNYSWSLHWSDLDDDNYLKMNYSWPLDWSTVLFRLYIPDGNHSRIILASDCIYHSSSSHSKFHPFQVEICNSISSRKQFKTSTAQWIYVLRRHDVTMKRKCVDKKICGPVCIKFKHVWSLQKVALQCLV